MAKNQVKQSAYMTVRDLSTYLNISTNVIYKLVKTGELKHTRIGSKILFSKQFISEWISRHSN